MTHDPIRKDSLCSSCKFSLCIDHGSERHPERLVFCHFVSTNNGRSIPQPVRECDHYVNKHELSLEQMESVAWIIETTDKPVAEVGFHDSPRERRFVIRPPGSEDGGMIDARGEMMEMDEDDEDFEDED